MKHLMKLNNERTHLIKSIMKSRAAAENFPGGGGQRKKDRQLAQKDGKITKKGQK